MATETKTASGAPEHPFPPPGPYGHSFPGGSFPPPGYPQYYSYPPPPEGHGDPNNPNGPQPGAPYMMAYPPPPPGMVYAFPPPPLNGSGQGFTPAFPPSAMPPALSKPKRKQVKMACTNCAAACKRCDEQRPCERCIKYGVSDTCVDGQRKERKKGIKRGPYKRRNKGEAVDTNYAYSPASADAEWQQSPQAQTPTSPATTSAAIHAVAQYAPEGYYSYFYPPPSFIPPGHEGQPGSEVPPPSSNGQPPPGYPYFIHPGAYPYPHYPPGPFGFPGGGPPGPPPPLEPDAHAKEPDKASDEAESGEAPKKRMRTTKGGDGKVKKVKSTRTQKGSKSNEIINEPHEPDDGPSIGGGS